MQKRDTCVKKRASRIDKICVQEYLFPGEYKLVNTDRVTVVITATIDEDGNVIEPYLEIPFYKDFDNIAVKIFNKSRGYQI